MKNVHTVTKDKRQHRFLTLVVNCAIGVNALLLLIAGMYPSAETWGMHHLAFYPPIVRFAALLLIMSLLIPAVRRFWIKLVETLTVNIRRQKTYRRYLVAFIVLILSGVLFWVERTATHFLGDGYLWIRNIFAIVSDPDLLVNTREPFVNFVIFNLEKMFLTLSVDNSVESAYRTLSIVSGLTFIVLVWYLANLISKERVERMLIMLFLFASGASQLFFGYVENYALAYCGITLFLLVSLAYLQRKVSIVLPIIVFSILVVIHFGTAIFLPAFFPLIRESFRRKETRSTILASLLGMILIPALLWISGFSPDMIIRAFGKGGGQLLPLLTVSTIYHSYTLFSTAHAMDVFNLLFLLQPAAFVLLFASGWLWQRSGIISAEKPFLVLAMLSAAAFMTLLSCDLGMSRDWDLMAPFGVVFSVAAVYGWFCEVQESTEKRELFAALTVMALLQTGLWIGINANETRALQRIDLLQEDPHWSIHAKYNLAEERAIYYRERKEYAKAAMYYERVVALQPSSFRFLGNLALAYIDMGNISRAIEVYKRIEKQGQANAEVQENLGILYAQSQRYGDALHHWYLADGLDSTSATIPFNIGVTIATYENSRKRALPYFLKTIKRDSLYAQSYYYAARCYKEMGDSVMARNYYIRYTKLIQVQQ